MCTFHSSPILLFFPLTPPCAEQRDHLQLLSLISKHRDVVSLVLELKYKQKLITQPCDIKFNEPFPSTEMSQKTIKKKSTDLQQ